MYDGGVIAADTKITLQDAELVTYEWGGPGESGGLRTTSMVHRLRECYRALETGETLEMSNPRLAGFCRPLRWPFAGGGGARGD